MIQIKVKDWWAGLSEGERAAWIEANFGKGGDRSAVEIPHYFPTKIPWDDRRIRVGFACPCLYQGGAEAWQLTLVKSLANDINNRFVLMGCAVVGGGIDSAMQGKFERFMPVAVGRNTAKVLASQCDVLITWAVEDLPELVAGLARPPKTMAVCHAPPESPWGQSVYARCRPDRFVAVSELALQCIPKEQRSAAKVIWNAVDEDRLTPRRDWAAMRKAWGVPRGAKVAGFYQRLSAEKDPYAAVRLAGSLPDDWWVVVIGSGCELAAMASQKIERGLDRLVILEPDHDAGSVMRAMDCIVIASEYESFCLTMGEALWVGLPIISTNVGLAKMNPGFTRLVPYLAEGETLARAVLADDTDRGGTRTRVARGMRFAQERLSQARFGREWGDYLCGLASLMPSPALPSPALPATQLEQVTGRFDGARERDIQLLILGCEYRGAPVVPCGCTKTHVCLRGDMGRAVAGRDFREVSGRDCRACVGG